MQKIPLSVAIITKNEEKRLPDCLKSISFANDIVVLDCGSTDRTVEIANNFGCRTFVEEWKGFGAQKNSAVTKCRYEWVLVIDADERVPEETKSEIVRIINSLDSADAYSFPRKNLFHGKWIKHSGWWPDRIIRLFRKSKGGVSDSLVHESVKVNGRVTKLNTPLIHNPIKNLSDVLAKINLYSSLGADSLFQKKRKISTFTAFLKGITAFFELYFLRLGVIGGYEGFVISFSYSVSTCYKYLKLKEKSIMIKEWNGADYPKITADY